MDSKNSAVETVLKRSGFESFNPVQKAALDAGLLGDKNMVVAAPTASGKTLIAEIAALDAVNKGKKVVYVVPLKALATEKYNEFTEKYAPLGIKTAISIGDLDSSDTWLSRYDIIIVTSEKLDSLMRHGITWIDDIGLVIVDEMHLIDSSGRGPTLEIVLTKLRQTINPKILGISATISNYEELAEWLDAVPVKSDYRPVKLYSGVYYDSKVFFHPEMEIDVPGSDPLESLVSESIEKGKQCLVFISTRRGAEAAAEKLGETISKKLSFEDRKKLRGTAQDILNALSHPTAQCRRIAGCIQNGTAFHHAGLTNKQREIIEKAYKEGIIKVITATPTLAAGINLPAWRVIIRDLKRFSSGRGMDYIPVMEIQQMAGRAGRPKYDTEGQAILITKSEKEAEFAWENYVHGEPERVLSKLGVEPVLRTHVLALIASSMTPTRESLVDFFSNTFYAHQYESLSDLKFNLDRIVSMLREYGFIEGGSQQEGPFRSASSMFSSHEELRATKIGRRVSELYIDPLTAHALIKRLSAANENGATHFGILHAMSYTLEMYPLLAVKKSDEKILNEIMLSEGDSLLEKPPNPWDIDYDEYLASLKTALLFNEWTEETGEDTILEKFRVTPGELRARLNNADWILYSMQELGLLLGYKDTLKHIRKARIRIKHGIREELIPLVKLRGIGRVKARQLYSSGFSTLEKLRAAPLETLSRVVGPKTARSVKEQL